MPNLDHKVALVTGAASGMGAACAEVLHMLGARDFSGSVVVEVNTRKMSSVGRRSALADSLSFARQHLAAGAQNRGRGPVALTPEEG